MNIFIIYYIIKIKYIILKINIFEPHSVPESALIIPLNIMLPSRALTLLMVLTLTLTLMCEDVNAARRRRRRRRRNRPEEIDGVRRGGRRLRHAASRREEFVKRRLRKFRNRHGDYEGKTRLVDGRAEYEGEITRARRALLTAGPSTKVRLRG